MVGNRLRHGWLPFVDIFDRKPIGLFLIYAGADALGCDGFLQYKLVALAFVVATALLIVRVAHRYAGLPAATIAGAFYILWLDFMEGEGGQSPVFYNLPMMVAAAILVRTSRRSGSTRWSGALAMTFVGLAMQIKYSAIFEGLYFGCWLICAAWSSGERIRLITSSIALWIACALMPTLSVFTYYESLGQGQAFAFANFLSALAQGRSLATDQLAGAATMVGIIAIPGLVLWLGWRGRRWSPGDGAPTRFLIGWLAASVAGIVIYWRFTSPQYAMPVLLPVACLLAQVFGGDRQRRAVAVFVAIIAFAAGQIVLAVSEARKGGPREAALVAQAADPRGTGCIYVYDGYPGLYMLTHSCLPTRWPFPAHLSTLEEAHSAALGVDPAVELRRVLATHPVAIVDDFPRFSGGNPVTHRLLQSVLDADYALAACVATGPHRVRLVYRRRSEAVVHPERCPSATTRRLGH